MDGLDYVRFENGIVIDIETVKRFLKSTPVDSTIVYSFMENTVRIKWSSDRGQQGCFLSINDSAKFRNISLISGEDCMNSLKVKEDPL